MQTEAAKVEHLYVHVPFCVAKCAYCAFYSEAGSAAKMSDYVAAVLAELERSVAANLIRGSGEHGRENVSRLQPTTIFFGGGTPSILPAPLMRRLLEAVGRARSRDCGSAPCEWTVEANPATVDREKARMMHDAGVNRISLGVQSFDDALLKALGRVHSSKQAVATYELLRKSGFENINLDLMFGLPGQTVAQFAATLQRSIALQPEHVSIYCLTLEEDTEFWLRFKSGCLSSNEEQNVAMYKLSIETLEAAGYHQYEVSNFAKPGRECAHNIAYWKVKDYIGIGPSACSTIGTRRWENVANTNRYIVAMKMAGRNQDRIGAGISPYRGAISFEERLTPELRAAERAAFGMRMHAGVPADLIQGRWDKEIAELLSAELVQWRNGRLQPTRRGILFADEVASEFV